MNGLIGHKIGMTRIFTKEGVSIPITVVEIKVNRVAQIKKISSDGYNAVQLTCGNIKLNRINKPQLGHFNKKNVPAGSILKEFSIKENENINYGQCFDVSFFSLNQKVDVVGFSKGRGFSGTVKRWNFRTQDASHGNSLSHRAPGSIGQNQTPGRVFKGKKMAGQYGNERVTIKNLVIVNIDKKQNLLLIKGSVPGSIGNYLLIKLSNKH